MRSANSTQLAYVGEGSKQEASTFEDNVVDFIETVTVRAREHPLWLTDTSATSRNRCTLAMLSVEAWRLHTEYSFGSLWHSFSHGEFLGSHGRLWEWL